MKVINYDNFIEKTLQKLAGQSADDLFDSYAMRRALRLAGRGIAEQISPDSPLVGCLIVCEDGNIIGEGFYGSNGLKHAEQIALEIAMGHARNSTVYVTLEPHAHFSRTPPCTDALVEAGVRRVVVAMIDPNPLVAGKGIRKLREHGIQTEVGLLEKSARRLNRFYIEKFAVRAEKSAGLIAPVIVGAN
ncbi:MAG: bifunctional diaminohydroxyphosphoribosylaminopyrimidine deaminase/5-amino-6-(5-phosphoribosylamino)uracil reductase RibD [Acidobacteriota bacterium]